MNREETLRLGRDIDEASRKADILSRQLQRLAERCGVKPPPVQPVITRKYLESVMEDAKQQGRNSIACGPLRMVDVYEGRYDLAKELRDKFFPTQGAEPCSTTTPQ